MSAPSEKGLKLRPFEILLDRKLIDERIKSLGEQITRDYAGEIPVLVGVLKGCVVFLADLMRQIKLPMELEFLSAASYRKGVDRKDDIIFGSAIPIQLKGRHVLLVEGVVDSGRTVSRLTQQVLLQEPASVAVVTLIDKPNSHRTPLEPKYVGFSLGNEFVIGFGLDNTQQYRNLPFIGRMVD
ncbi:MAG: hypoxanthine phosphoribosyltransferase [bacterium]